MTIATWFVLAMRLALAAVVVAVSALAFGPPVAFEGAIPGVDKVQHCAAFVVMAVLAALAAPRQPLWRPAACLLLFGIAIEVIQGLPAIGRDSSGWDVAADAAGILIGLGPLILSARLRAMRPSPARR